MLRMSSLAMALLAMAFTSGAQAAAGMGSYTLPWNTRGEVLEYRSCGCGDSCWVAEVRNAHTRALKGRLRCDCERLHAQVGPKGVERVQAASCPADGDGIDKPRAIRESLEHLLQR
ncbi:hypothetical protein SAMN03159363_0254 [Variovorax sp. EL159]|nr:hypothetical protein SAMN03159363_0254 [Variovorax sp. EL159]